MKQPTTITSKQNQRVKDIVKLQTKHGRDKANLFLVEGIKECEYVLSSQSNKSGEVKIVEVWLSEDKQQNFDDLLSKVPADAAQFLVPADIFQKICFKNDSEGILFVCEKFARDINTLNSLNKMTDANTSNLQAASTSTTNATSINSASSLILILDRIDKPGNIGALLRTADAVGAKAVIVTNQSTDMFNENVIRNSVGTFFAVPWFLLDCETTLQFLKQGNYEIVSADPYGKTIYFDLTMPRKMALVVGNEHEGLSEFWKKHADHLVNIPMLGQNDSLNVNVACGIMLYEWVRQTKVR